MPIPVMHPELDLGPAFLPYLEEIEAAGIYSNFGPQARAYTREVADLLGVQPNRVVTASNATAALAGAVAILSPAEWLTPSWTFAASLHAVMAAKKSLVLGEVNPKSYVLSADGLTAGQGAVVTAPFGAQVDIGEEWNRAEAIVVDAAAAIGAPPVISSDFRKPWAAIYSLHATKILGIGEGAIAVFANAELAEAFRSWTNFGFAGSRVATAPGVNAKMSEFHAAVGRFRLTRWNEDRARWRKIRKTAHRLADDLGINVTFSDPNWVSPYWIVQFDSAFQKQAAMNALTRADIETRDWWGSGCHLMPAFEHLSKNVSLEVTEHLGRTSAGLPFFVALTEEQMEKVGSVIAEAIHPG